MKQLVIAFSLLLSILSTAFAQNPSDNRPRFSNEYLYFGGLSFTNTPGKGPENILRVYNMSDITFEVRAVFPELGIDTTFLVTPEGNHWFPGETWIWVGDHVRMSNVFPFHGRLHAQSTEGNIRFVLSDTYYQSFRRSKQ